MRFEAAGATVSAEDPPLRLTCADVDWRTLTTASRDSTDDGSALDMRIVVLLFCGIHCCFQKQAGQRHDDRLSLRLAQAPELQVRSGMLSWRGSRGGPWIVGNSFIALPLDDGPVMAEESSETLLK